MSIRDSTTLLPERRAGADCFGLPLEVPSMSASRPAYSRTAVKQAGHELAKQIPASWASEAEKEQVAHWFRIAHNWRSSHIVPMRMVRSELRARAGSKNGVIVVARLKRMESIRKKLKSRSLHQIQDIAGCRAIFASMDEVSQVLERYRAGDTKHKVADQDDYIARPKPSGYRCHHLVLQFQGEDDKAAFDKLRVEIQLRTRMQHAWATAVEAVGLYCKQDLKGGRGDPRWLRLFQLMGSEIAVSEGLPLVPGTDTSEHARRSELSALDEKLGAVATLEKFRRAVKDTDNFWKTSSKFYLIIFDDRTNTVSVRPYDSPTAGSAAYDSEEDKQEPTNAVLVEVDRVEDLKLAYPNYFLDVGLFASGLKNVLAGRNVALPSDPLPVVPRPSGPDLKSLLQDWFRSRRR